MESQHLSPRGLLKTDCSAPPPRVSDPLVLGWSPRICISNKFPGDANVGDSETTLGEPLQ